MGLDIWFKDDLANILRAANEANLSAMLASDFGSAIGGSGEADRELRRAYRRGFVAALTTLAQALGLPAADMQAEPGAAPQLRLASRARHLPLPVTGTGGRGCEE